MSLLVNEFDVRSVLHGQVSLEAVSQICVIYEVMNGCKDSLKDCFENVNIAKYNIYIVLLVMTAPIQTGFMGKK